MHYGTAKLTPAGRALLVHRVKEEGWSVTGAAAAAGVSRPTVYRWLKRFAEEGPVGMLTRSSLPRHSPTRTPADREATVIAYRREQKVGPHRIAYALGMAVSTVYAILRRSGLPRLRDLDRPTGKPLRYQRDHPGELIHIDVKKLARIPDGGGWRLLGRETGKKHSSAHRGRLGFDYLHTAVDDASRMAYIAIRDDERGETCAAFLHDVAEHFANHDVAIQSVMTDRALNYTRAAAFKEALANLGARHLTTRPYRPQTNGKVERFHRTLQEEAAYQQLYRSNHQRRLAIEQWLIDYNATRPHTALNGRSPLQTIQNCQQRP